MRTNNNDANHEIESAGQGIVLLGVGMIFYDSYSLERINPSIQALDTYVHPYLFRDTW